MKIKQKDIVVFSVIKENECGLLNPLTRKLHRINKIGRFIWEACKEPRTIAELVSMVVKNFHIPEETAQRDVEEFVDRMIQYQLLEES